MERLTKTELRALLECIKECYPICDRQTFTQRVLSRLSKKVPTEFTSYNWANLRSEEHPTTKRPQVLASRGLSPREAQVLGWVSLGKTNKEIGVILELSARTVQKHLEHIYKKMGVENRTGAAAKAYAIASIASK